MKHFSMVWVLFALLLSTNNTYGQIIRLRKSSGRESGSVARDGLVRSSDGSSLVKVRFRLRQLSLTRKSKGAETLSRLAIDKLPLTSDIGSPALPFQAITVDAAPSDIRVIPLLGEPVSVRVGKIEPAQVEPCRCPELQAKTPAYVDNVRQFKAAPSGFVVQGLGDFRGQPVSRVLLYPHKYDPKTGILQVYPEARFEISYNLSAKARQEKAYDYLVLTPRDLAGGLANWIDWKRSSQGLSFRTVIYEDIGSPDAQGLKSWFHEEYARAGFRYVLIVGGRNRIPQAIVETTTDRNTPSDLPYFTMGDSSDVIPEAYAGRVVADNTDSLQKIFRKWMDYERDTESSSLGWKRAVGIASNEGSNPSDADYINAIQAKFQSSYGSELLNFHQNNADSNPVNFNNQLNQGAMWVTYIGHGSGTSWPSFGQSYSVSHISELRNAGAVKPVWIDVACLNGALDASSAGVRLTTQLDPNGNPVGVTAYYGGTVLVSWHPPAIFSRGVAFKLADMVRPLLGEALQAGQHYLTEQTSNLQDIASNQRWYHLQGDPSLRLRLK